LYAQADYGAVANPGMTQEQMFAPAPTYAAEPAFAAKEDPFAGFAPATTTEVQPVAAAPAYAPQPVAPAPAPVVQTSGPQLPATGLPEGWTMEQWNHYGAQYLAAQQGQPAAIQPASTDTTPAAQGSNLSGLLDDFDL
jgi:hypothetical protein